MENFKTFIAEKIKGLKEQGNPFEYHVLDLPESDRLAVENSHADFYKEWYAEELFGKFMSLNKGVNFLSMGVSLICRIDGTTFFIRFY